MELNLFDYRTEMLHIRHAELLAEAEGRRLLKHLPKPASTRWGNRLYRRWQSLCNLIRPLHQQWTGLLKRRRLKPA